MGAARLIIIIIIERSTMKTGSSKCCGHGRVMLQSLSAAAAAKGKEYPENDGSGSQTDQYENTGNGTCVLKEPDGKTG
jgi:hypothetical protein